VFGSNFLLSFGKTKSKTLRSRLPRLRPGWPLKDKISLGTTRPVCNIIELCHSFCFHLKLEVFVFYWTEDEISSSSQKILIAFSMTLVLGSSISPFIVEGDFLQIYIWALFNFKA
jgi:hypothetical protein